jgi:hypothetical protein
MFPYKRLDATIIIQWVLYIKTNVYIVILGKREAKPKFANAFCFNK